ncbi:23S rRNA (uracil-5-)-methyltransferase RumA [Bacteroidia bacterium]|nr:23S rRNA (uracil-5-)-methyltransferase RumA [Bacteroidia bacterium]
MARNKKELPVLERALISGVAAEGNAIAKVDELVVFVPYAAPGDVADIQLTKKKNSYAEGKVVKVHTFSPLREEPFCSHFSVCGGCKWQHLKYEEQIKCKQQQVADCLRRIGKVEVEEMFPIIGSRNTRHYRNKLEFTFSNKKWLTDEEIQSPENFERNGLGFHIPGKFDKVLDIETCYLQDDISNRIRRSVKAYCLSHEGYPFFDLRSQEGLMRNLIIRTSATTGEVMLIVVFARDEKAEREALLSRLVAEFPEITSLLYVINGKCNDTIGDLEAQLFHGKDHIIEEMEALRFRIGAKSFYQTNSLQAYELYKVVREFAGLQGGELVYDLYTGTGTIANFVASRAAEVIGIEYVAEAVADAHANAALNGIGNVSFFAGDMKDLLTEGFITQHGRPDVVITDPPRAGMHEDVVRAILFAAPRRIVYVSCNPATQARDLSLLAQDYGVRKTQPVDMFPHTQHVENVALLLRKEDTL